MKSLAIFDFDGTLTKKDSLFAFLQFSVGQKNFYLGFIVLLPVLILYKIGLIKNSIAKQLVLKYFFKNWSVFKFQKCCEEFGLKIIPEILRTDAMERLNWHIKENHRIVIVTASPENWVLPWAARNNIEVIGTMLEIIDDKVTGNFLSKNCHGLEKINRIKEYVDLNQYYSYGYGDTPSDKYFLAILNESYYKIFKS